MPGTFISYRREDAAGYAGRLRESLERRLGTARVFRDVDTLRPGQDFVQAIETRLSDCRVMLAVIGREWVDARDLTGSRRLDDPYDFVRLEVAAALQRPEVLVVPVLVEGASMPAASELPENIRILARRHAVSVRDETWDSDVDRLVGVIESAEPSGGSARADAPIPPARLWAAGAVALAVLALLLFTQNRGGRGGRDGTSTPDGVVTSAPGQPGTTAATSPAALPGGGSPYTIDVPRVAEAAFDDVTYAVVSGNVVMREGENELRLRIRIMNTGRYDVVFWDDSFRLVVGGEVRTPTSGLNSSAAGNSLKYGVITFRIPQTARAGILRIVVRDKTAEIPLDLSPTGRPPLDETAEIADSMSQAILREVLRDHGVLLDAADVTTTLTRATTRRFANTLRLNLSIRMENHGRAPKHSGVLTLRVQAGGEVVPPIQFPNEALDPMASSNGTVVFDLPTTVTRATLIATSDDKRVELPLELK